MLDTNQRAGASTALIGTINLPAVLGHSAASHLFLLVPTLVTLQIYDRVLPSRRLETLMMLGLVSLVALVAWWMVEAARARWLSAYAAKVESQLTTTLSSQFLSAHLQGAGKVAHQLWQDIATLRAFLASPAVLGVIDLPWSVVYLSIIFAFHPLLGAVGLAGMLSLVLLAWASDALLRKPAATAEATSGQASQQHSELASFAEVLHAHGQQNQVNIALVATKNIAAQQRLAAELPGHNLKTFGKLARQALQLTMLSTGAWLVLNQSATGGVMIAGSILLGKALMPFELLIGSWKQVIDVRKACARLQQALARQAALDDSQPELTLPAPRGQLQAQALGLDVGALSTPQAGVGNSVTPNPSKNFALRNISFALEPGEMLAVLGPSGCGKSTLARALVGISQPTQGNVLLDGAALHQYSQSARGQATGYLPQDVQLHSGSVAHNIARQWQSSAPLTPEQSQQVVAAAQMAGAHELITSLPQGYDTPLGRSAHVLSGGQRQRIGLARAVYGSPAVVVLDEPNSQLDGEGEAALERCLRALSKAGSTVVAITHRPHLIELAHKVLLLQAGQTEQYGSREHVRQWIAQRQQVAIKNRAACAVATLAGSEFNAKNDPQSPLKAANQ